MKNLISKIKNNKYPIIIYLVFVFILNINMTYANNANYTNNYIITDQDSIKQEYLNKIDITEDKYNQDIIYKPIYSIQKDPYFQYLNMKEIRKSIKTKDESEELKFKSRCFNSYHVYNIVQFNNNILYIDFPVELNKRNYEEFKNIIYKYSKKNKYIILNFKNKEGGEKETYTNILNDLLYKFKYEKMIILTNNNTTSAFEYLSTNLKDKLKDNCIIIGTPTYGKMYILAEYKIKDGMKLIFSINILKDNYNSPITQKYPDISSNQNAITGTFKYLMLYSIL